MNESNENALKEAERQLELVKQKDRLLEDIEIRLHTMKDIAEYAAAHPLSTEEAAQLNKQVAEQMETIEELKRLLDRL